MKLLAVLAAALILGVLTGVIQCQAKVEPAPVQHIRVAE